MPRINQGGYSLVELLVATALGLLLLASSAPLFLSMLTQQSQAQQRLEEIEAVRFASQIITQHIRDANEIGFKSQATLIDLGMPESPPEKWISYACVRSGENSRIQLEFQSSTASLRCRNPSEGGSFQSLIEGVWAIEFSYSCPRQHLRAGTTPPLPNTLAANMCTQCPEGIEAVTTTITSPSKDGYPPTRISWTTANRQAYWRVNFVQANNPPCQSN
jgi:type II secretory pathway pseudopilin PulG